MSERNRTESGIVSDGRTWRQVRLEPAYLHSLKDACKKPRGPREEAVTEALDARGKGKITDAGYDRMLCRYIRIPASWDFTLRALLRVTAFQSGCLSRQSGFGLFVRDTLQPDRLTGEYYANMAAVGGFGGHFGMFGRDGVKAFGKGKIRSFFPEDPEDRPDRVLPGEERVLSLELKREGRRFLARISDGSGRDLPAACGPENARGETGTFRLEDGRTCLFLEPKAMCRRDRKYQYVGLFAARDAAFVPVPGSISLTAGPASSHSREDRREERPEKPRTGKKVGGRTAYGLPHSRRRPSEGRVIFASPDGQAGADGSREHPLDVRTAAEQCGAGGTVVLLRGWYRLTEDLVLDERCTGRTIRGEGAAEESVLDFGGGKAGLCVRGNGWRVENLTVTAGLGIRVEGCGNTVFRCRAFRNRETGILIRCADDNAPLRCWPCGNLVESCVSFENADPSGTNADGFACKVSAGRGNRFRRCLAYRNADDGFDLFSKNRPIGAVRLTECTARENGWRKEDGHMVPAGGNGCGFKLGGSGLAVPHRAAKCRAYDNYGYGFFSNSNPVMILKDCRAFGNRRGEYSYMFTGTWTRSFRRWVRCKIRPEREKEA